MKRVVLLLGLIAAYISIPTASAQFYYGTDGPIQLSVDSFRVLIKFDQSFAPHSQELLLASIDRIVCGIDDRQIFDGFICCSLSTGIQYTVFLDSLDTLGGIYLVEPYYRYNETEPFPVGEQFIVAFDETLSSTQIDSINAEYGTVTDHLIYGFQSVYVLRNTDSSGMRVLDLANL